MSFRLRSDHRGAGRAREALSLIVGYAFDDLRAHRVTANAYSHNDRSRRPPAAVGFVEGGVGREDAFVGGAYEDTLRPARTRVARTAGRRGRRRDGGAGGCRATYGCGWSANPTA